MRNICERLVWVISGGSRAATSGEKVEGCVTHLRIRDSIGRVGPVSASSRACNIAALIQ